MMSAPALAVVGAALTVGVAVLLEEMVDEHGLCEPEARDVTVIVGVPAVVSPVAVNVPVPAVLTVMDAVRPVWLGELVL